MLTINFIKLILVGLSLLSAHTSEPLPESKLEIKSVTGTIVHCDFHELGTWGFEIFAGIQLDTPKSPYLRFNFLRTEWPRYQNLCIEHAEVTINYQVKSTELRPELTYWGVDINVVEKNKDQK